MKYYRFRYIVTYNHTYTIEAYSKEEAQSLLDSFTESDVFNQNIDEEALENWEANYEHHFEEEVDERYYTHFDKVGDLVYKGRSE